MSNELDFLVEDANSTDQETVRIGGTTYPFIQWISGDDKMDEESGIRYSGGFFAPKNSIDLTGVPGWTATYIKRNDKEGKPQKIEGFGSTKLMLAVINQRHRYEVLVKGAAMPEVFSHNQFEQAEARAAVLRQVDNQVSAKKKSQFLIVIKGIEQPVMLTVRGAMAKSFSGQNGLIQFFDRNFMSVVAAELKKAGTNNLLPSRRFWMEIGIATDAKGNPMFTPFGPSGRQTNMVPPAIYLPNPVTPSHIRDAHVGVDNRTKFDKLYTESLEWSKAWDNTKPAAVNQQLATTGPVVDPETASALADM